jgi:hypothetical protein
MWPWKRRKVKNELTLIANKYLAARGMEPWVLPDSWRYASGDYSAYKIDGSIAGDRFLFTGPDYSSLRFISLNDGSLNGAIAVKRSDTGYYADEV